MTETRKKRGPLPPVFFLAALLTAVALHYGLPLATILPEPWNLAGILPLVLGLCAILLSAAAFGRAGTAIIPFEESSVLVVNGFYRYTRTPRAG